jgi:hypothetical protein
MLTAPTTSTFTDDEDEGWTFNMHDGFVESSDEAEGEESTLPKGPTPAMGSQKLPGTPGPDAPNPKVNNDGGINFWEREDNAVFERNPWSIAKLNAQSRQQHQRRNHVSPTQRATATSASTPALAPTLQPHGKEVATVTNCREKAWNNGRNGMDARECIPKTVARKMDPNGSVRVSKTFPILKAFQNSKQKIIVPISRFGEKTGANKRIPYVTTNSVGLTSSMGSRSILQAPDSTLSNVVSLPGTAADFPKVSSQE